MIDDHEMKMAQDPGYIQFICLMDGNQYEEINLCNNITNIIDHQQDTDIVCKLKFINLQEERIIPSQPNYKQYW